MRGTSESMADGRQTRIATNAAVGPVVAHVAILAGVMLVPRPQAPVVESAVVDGVEVEVVNEAEANANAKPRRVVHARLLDSKVL